MTPRPVTMESEMSDLVQAAVAAALREAAALFEQDALDMRAEEKTLYWTSILALITPDAQAALDRVVAAERERCAKVAGHDDRIKELKAERNALAEENERLRNRVKLGRIHRGALAEIKATVDGKSDQPVADIISGCIAAVAAYRATLAELKGQGDE
jgi:hypothetical protein